MNIVHILGRLGADPEVRTFNNGGRVCNLRVAISETWKDKGTGERRERTEWVPVAITNDGLVGVAERYLRKGARVQITGQLHTRKWTDQSGADRYTTEVAVRPFGGALEIIDWPERDAGDRQGGFHDHQHAAGYEAQRPADDLDSEIPF